MEWVVRLYSLFISLWGWSTVQNTNLHESPVSIHFQLVVETSSATSYTIYKIHTVTRLAIRQSVMLPWFRKNECSLKSYNFGGAGMAQWREPSPPTNVARFRLPDPTSYVGWVCWFSTLQKEVVLRGTPVFPSPQKSTFDLICVVDFSLQCPQLVLKRW